MRIAHIYTLFSLFLVQILGKEFAIRVMKYPILKQVPVCMKHHAFVISEMDASASKPVYLVDYSPIVSQNETVLQMRMKLLLGNWVPAEVRVRCIKDVNFFDDMEILNSPYLLEVANAEESRKITAAVYKKISNKDIQTFIGKLIERGNDKQNQMNLYQYNCQSFCSNNIEL